MAAAATPPADVLASKVVLGGLARHLSTKSDSALWSKALQLLEKRSHGEAKTPPEQSARSQAGTDPSSAVTGAGHGPRESLVSNSKEHLGPRSQCRSPKRAWRAAHRLTAAAEKPVDGRACPFSLCSRAARRPVHAPNDREPQRPWRQAESGAGGITPSLR